MPVFAFFAAGVTVIGGGFADAVTDPAAIGVVVGLVVGKTIGVFGGTWAVARFTRAELDEDLSWTDVFGLSVLGGVGFTVSLLVGELAFGTGSARDDHVKLAVLVGSLIAALLAAVVLRSRNRHYRDVHDRETAGPRPRRHPRHLRPTRLSAPGPGCPKGLPGPAGLGAHEPRAPHCLRPAHDPQPHDHARP